MGRASEDTFDCMGCGGRLVYEPAHEKEVECWRCHTVHAVTVTATTYRIIKPSPIKQYQKGFERRGAIEAGTDFDAERASEGTKTE